MWPWAGKTPGLLFRTQISFLEEQYGSSSVHFLGQVKFLNAPTEFEHLKCSLGSHWLRYLSAHLGAGSPSCFCSVMSNSSWPHGLQHAMPPCPSPTPRACSNSCPLNWWCHPTISSSVAPFSSCRQSFPTSGSFQMSQLFASGGQSIGASAVNELEGISPSNEYSGLISFRIDWFDLLAVQGTLKSSPASQFKSINSLSLGFLWLAVNINFGHLQGSSDSTHPQIKCIVFLLNLAILPVLHSWCWAMPFPQWPKPEASISS